MIFSRILMCFVVTYLLWTNNAFPRYVLERAGCAMCLLFLQASQKSNNIMYLFLSSCTKILNSLLRALPSLPVCTHPTKYLRSYPFSWVSFWHLEVKFGCDTLVVMQSEASPDPEIGPSFSKTGAHAGNETSSLHIGHTSDIQNWNISNLMTVAFSHLL